MEHSRLTKKYSFWDRDRDESDSFSGNLTKIIYFNMSSTHDGILRIILNLLNKTMYTKNIKMHTKITAHFLKCLIMSQNLYTILK